MKNVSQAKSMLITTSELLQKKDKDLFGMEFREQLSETVKANKKSNELLASTVIKDPPSVNRPFLKGPPQNQNQLRGVKPLEQAKVISNSEARTTTTTIKEIIRTKVNMTQKRATFFKEIPSLLPRKEILYTHKLVKKLFLQKSFQKYQ